MLCWTVFVIRSKTLSPWSDSPVDSHHMNRLVNPIVTALLLAVALVIPAQQVPAQQVPVQSAPNRAVTVLGGHVLLPTIADRELRAMDEQRMDRGAVAHYAVAHEVAISPWHEDRWRLVDGRAHWRVRISSPGALSLNLLFGRYVMPDGGRLSIRSVDGSQRLRPFTEADNDAHGQLWTPPLASDDLWVELSVPVEELDALELELTRVHHGYAGFGEPSPKAGECHIETACSVASGWHEAARSVALISIAGVRFCSGFLVNNTALDGRPFFITAAHCDIDQENAASVVVIWKHQRATCDPSASPEPVEWAFQSGAIWRATNRSSDTVLLELDDPPPAEAEVFFAGWDRSPEPPAQAVTIHHPNTDTKRISFDFDQAIMASYLKGRENPRAHHWRIDGWDLGSTEGGSSGAPLFNADRRVVGQLHGGHAACGNHQPDWFGRFASAWRGRGRLGSRLSDWLDPLGTDAQFLDGLDDVSR